MSEKLDDLPVATRRRRDLALKIVEMGFGIFPLRPGTKKPYKNGGIKRATTDKATVEKWFKQRPTMNYGVSTTDHVVIDIDIKDGKDGLNEWHALEAEHGPFDDTFTVKSPSGGVHYYYPNWPSGQSPLAPGVDVRGHHGYVVGPGSVLDGSGDGDAAGEYKIIDDREPPWLPPTGLMHLLQIPNERRRDGEHDVSEFEYDQPHNVKRAVDYLQNQETCFRGERDNTCYRLCCQLRDWAIEESTIVELLIQHWDCQPMLDHKTIADKAFQAYKCAQNEIGAGLAENDFKDVMPPDDIDDEFTDYEFHQVERKPVSELGRDPHLIEGILMLSQMAMLVSSPGVGKSTFVFCICCMVALNKGDWFGYGDDIEFNAGGAFLTISPEDTQDKKAKRMEGIISHYGLDGDLIFKKWHNMKDENAGFKVVTRNNERRLVVDKKRIKKLKQYIRKHGIQLVVFDPYVEMHDGVENDNVEMAAVSSAMREIVRDLNVAGLIVHHSTKNTNIAGNLDAARGAGSTAGLVRNAFTLVPASVEDMDGTMTEDEVESIRRLDVAKGNYRPPGKDTKFFEMLSVELPNGDFEKGLKNETVGVFKPFNKEKYEKRRDDSLFDLIDVVLQNRENEAPLNDVFEYIRRDAFFQNQNKDKLKELIKFTFGDGGIDRDNVNLKVEQRGQRWFMVRTEE